MMVLDECVPYGADREYTEKSLALTTAWAKRCREAYLPGEGQNLLFGIVQGGFFEDLRRKSAEQILSIPFDGYALGGLSVGESGQEMLDMLRVAAPLLPPDKPRYLMGVGAPTDILNAVELGMDMFDCVLPTRNARTGTLFTSLGKINIKRAEFKEDSGPLDPSCNLLHVQDVLAGLFAPPVHVPGTPGLQVEHHPQSPLLPGDDAPGAQGHR